MDPFSFRLIVLLDTDSSIPVGGTSKISQGEKYDVVQPFSS
jgi:hypothetical protein